MMDLDEIQKEITEAQGIRNTIDKLAESGTTWVLSWNCCGENSSHDLTRSQESNLRKLLLEDWNARLSHVEEKLENLITKKQ